MKNILLGFLFGVAITTASALWITRNTEVTPEQLEFLSADRVTRAIEIDGTVVAILEKDNFYTSNPPDTMVAIFPKSHSTKEDGFLSQVVLEMIEGKWKSVYAVDKVHRQIGTKIDDEYSFSKASLFGPKYSSFDRNFDGFIDNRISKPLTQNRSTKYFTSDGLVSQEGPTAPLLNELGNIVEIEWKESGYEIIKGS